MPVDYMPIDPNPMWVSGRMDKYLYEHNYSTRKQLYTFS